MFTSFSSLKEVSMFSNRRAFVALVACLCVSLSSSVFAGGNGGTKKDATITIKNETSAPIGVAVDPNSKVLAAASAGDLAAFKANGGVVVEAGATYKVQVKSGAHRILVGDASFLPIADTNKTVEKGKTLAGYVTDSGLIF
jgi:hypothetical protein